MFKLAELFVAITGNAAPLNATLAGVHSKLMGFGTAGTQAGNSFMAGMAGGLGVGIPMLGVGMAGVVGLGLALGKGTMMAMRFEDQLNLMSRTITDSTAEGMVQLEADLRAMATEADLAGVSLEQLGGAAIMGGRMGIGIGQMRDFVRTAAEISIALDDIPVEDAVQGITQVLGSFGKGVEEARNFGGALDALSNNARTTGGEILDVANRLKSGAANLGMSPQDLLALSTAMKDVGIGTELAGTNMGVVLTKMASDTTRFAKVAGMSVEEFERTLDEGPLEALKAFIGGLEGGRADLGLLAELGFTGERAKMVIMSLSQSMDRLTDFQRISNEEWASMAYFNRDVATATQSSSAQLTRSWNRVKDVLISLGNTVLPAVTGGLDLVADAAEGVAYVASTMWGTLAGQITGLEEYQAAARGVGSAWEWVSGKLSGFWDTAKFVFDNWTTIAGVVGIRMRELGINSVEALQWAGTAAMDFGDWLASEWLFLVGDAVEGALTIFRNLGENIRDLWAAVMEYLSTGTWSFEFTPLLDGFEATVKELPGLAIPVFTSLQDEIDALLGDAYGRVQEATDKAKQAAEELSGEAEASRAGRAGAADGGQTTDLAGFARELQQSALAGGVEQKQLAVAEQHKTLFEQFKAMQQQHNERQQRAFEKMMGRMGAV